MPERIGDVLMSRDNLTREEAEDRIAEAREELQTLFDEGDFASIETFCEDTFGLEPDYMDELLW